MILRLSELEFNLMQDALLAYSQSLRDQARPHCAGYSTTGMDLCAKRLAIEALVEDLRSNPTHIQPETAGKVVEIPRRRAEDEPSRSRYAN